MILEFDTSIADAYKSPSQKARVLTETWMEKHMFCPVCGNVNISAFENNKPVADFYCNHCKEEFELKSMQKISNRIVNGAYDTMINRITSSTNPHLFCLTYKDYRINNLIVIPKYFFTPHIIEPRQPLKETARRAGWIGCNINIARVPNSGKISIIKDSSPVPIEDVVRRFQNTVRFSTNNIENRRWLMDIMLCVDRVPTNIFSLSQIYLFEQELKTRHPNNNHIKDKIRQQLQVLRDMGCIEFLGSGVYKKSEESI